MEEDLNKLQETIKSYLPEADLDPVRKAYLFAKEAHKGQMRLSGQPYFSHPLAVANILASLNLDVTTITAGLLHDTIEDTEVTVLAVEAEFGRLVAGLVEGVSNVTHVARQTRERRRIENLRKVLLATAKDTRVILIKLADRLHNMCTLEHLPLNNRYRIAHETLEVYAPLAHRLGMGKMKGELEDLCLKYLHPEVYCDLKKKINEAIRQREVHIDLTKRILDEKLEKAGIKAEVFGRPKHFMSIYKKMTDQGKSFDEIYDLVGIRIITDDLKNCYGALGIIHALWTPIPGRFKDYIAVPKSNMYQALHTTVIGPASSPIEVQIKTEAMDQIAEDGVAAHFYYKEGSGADKELDEKLSWLKKTFLEWQQNLDSVDPAEFMENLKIDLFTKEIFVFTPKGEIKVLPAGATPVDFAYQIHTEIGDCCLGAKINGRIVPLRHKLSSGDMIEILTSSKAHPSGDWLNFVKTSKAKGRIRQYLREKLLETEPSQAKEAPIQREEKKPQIKKREISSSGISVSGVTNLVLNLARCCNPLPGDEIIGYITIGRGVSVHRLNCPNVLNLSDPQRRIEVFWQPEKEGTYEVEISALTHNRVGLLKDMLEVISATRTIINEADAKTTGDGLAKCHFRIVVNHLDRLKPIIAQLEKVEGVLEVYRTRSK